MHRNTHDRRFRKRMRPVALGALTFLCVGISFALGIRSSGSLVPVEVTGAEEGGEGSVRLPGFPVLLLRKDDEPAMPPLTAQATGDNAGTIPQIRKARFVPETVAPGGRTKLYVEVGDKNGIQTVTVIADFTSLRGDVQTMGAAVGFPAGMLARKNTFRSGDIVIPADLPFGVYDIPITVFDDTGNETIGGARIRIERYQQAEEEGSAPRIDIPPSFQTPRVFMNDNATVGEIHVLVHDPDDDVATVIAKIGAIGRATSASSQNVGGVALLCSVSSSLTCLERGPIENPTARWFVLKNIIVPPITLPGSEPYLIELTAIDAKGHTDEAILPVVVGGMETYGRLQSPPKLLMVVPVGSDEYEVVVSAPLDTRSIDRSGRQFLIQPTVSGLDSLRVLRVSWDTTAQLLYLQTEPLQPGETYTLSIHGSGTEETSPATDVYGNRFVWGRGGSITLLGYEKSGTALSIDDVEVVDKEHVDIHFATQVLPSSVHPDLLQSRVSLRSLLTGEERSILEGSLLNNAQTLRLRLDGIREGDFYKLRMTDILAPGLVEGPSEGLRKSFVAVFPDSGNEGSVTLPSPDLNGDGQVDFSDFALFSVVYGTEYGIDESREPPDLPRRSLAPQTFGGPMPNLKVNNNPIPRIDN